MVYLLKALQGLLLSKKWLQRVQIYQFLKLSYMYIKQNGIFSAHLKYASTEDMCIQRLTQIFLWQFKM